MRALKLLLFQAIENGRRILQVFGDSMVIINWENGIQCCHNLRLFPILEDIFLIKQHFDSFFIAYVYRERNALVDSLSKKEVEQLLEGQIQIERMSEMEWGGFYHMPFHEENAQEGWSLLPIENLTHIFVLFGYKIKNVICEDMKVFYVNFIDMIL